ncbi:MAG TPA: sulfite exporter TauE/SafE family protein, partial [Candidatus Saccharimonadales bacterium]|nr:sulfite exporter TauE/SafE family protein [Candidatus Saccharimonadales bacterium]
TPFYIAIGLTPQQSIATGKLGALGLDAGAIAAFRGKIKQYRSFTFLLMIIAIVVGFVSSYFIRNIRNENLQLVMGVMNLVLVPLVLLRHHRLKSRKKHYLLQYLSLMVIVAVLLMQGVFSSGIGSLVNVFLILFFGFSALEASLIKRQTSIALDVVVLAGLLGSGLINYEWGLIGMAGGISGGYIGSRFALHEGERFARYALVVFMVASGLWLVLTAS